MQLDPTTAWKLDKMEIQVVAQLHGQAITLRCKSARAHMSPWCLTASQQSMLTLPMLNQRTVVCCTAGLHFKVLQLMPAAASAQGTLNRLFRLQIDRQLDWHLASA